MATVEKIKSGLIDKIQAIQNREYLEALDKLISKNAAGIEIPEKLSIHDLPQEIVDILEMSDSEKLEDCIEHTTSKDIQKKK